MNGYYNKLIYDVHDKNLLRQLVGEVDTFQGVFNHNARSFHIDENERRAVT